MQMPSERRAQVLRQLESRGVCGIDELAESLDVSRVTVHRLLDNLESQGVVKKERGGVRLVKVDQAGTAFAQRRAIDLELKQEIARKALRLVGEGDAIFIDASTTAFCFAEALCEHAKSLSLTVITSSPAVLWQLVEIRSFHVIATGGELDHRLTSLTGPLALNAIDGLHFNKAFISPTAVGANGVMTQHSATADLLKKVIEKTAETILLAETPKFARVSPLFIAPIESIGRIVTDSKLATATKTAFRKLGAEVL